MLVEPHYFNISCSNLTDQFIAQADKIAFPRLFYLLFCFFLAPFLHFFFDFLFNFFCVEIDGFFSFEAILN